jgi:transcriptional regulator with XRE-family HTH domain
MLQTTKPVGELLREWRQRRRLSQLDLALDAEISTRHLSFMETGRASPSREMLLRLAEQLEVPLRDRNTLLVAAGFAPVFSERPLADPALNGARQAMDLVLAAHVPFPALAIDRLWQMVSANRAVAPLMDGVSPALMEPPINVLRVSLHPDGIAPRIANFVEWREHLLTRLRRQVEVSADAALSDLLQELLTYPTPKGRAPAEPEPGGPLVPLRLMVRGEMLNMISTTTVFGTPVDITVAELALEGLFPADEPTGAALRQLCPPA